MASVTVGFDGEAAATLIGQAAAGDEVAFARIVAAHHADMLRIAGLISGDVDLAAEAAQSAWAIAWRRLGTLRDPERLRPWLMAIAANEARQLARRRGRQTVREISVFDPEAGPAASGHEMDAALRLDLADAMARLDPRDRVLLALRYAGGLELQEIGRAVGMSATAVRSRLKRAIERLRKDLADA